MFPQNQQTSFRRLGSTFTTLMEDLVCRVVVTYRKSVGSSGNAFVSAHLVDCGMVGAILVSAEQVLSQLRALC